MINARIAQARKMRRLSQAELGRLIGENGQTVQSYESGELGVDSTTLIALSRALELPTEFFLRPEYLDEVHVPAYRSHPSLTRKQQDSIIATAQEALERYLHLALLTGPPVVQQLPDPFPVHVATLDEVENAADKLRETWQLGYDTIYSLVGLLEQRGIPVVEVEGNEMFDACALEFESRHGHGWVIVIRPDVPGDRLRFTVAHELGHLALETDELDNEDAANRFAAAFLVPRWAAGFELGEHREDVSLQELYWLKHEYGLSMQSWIHRAEELEVITEQRARNLRSKLDSIEGPTREPGSQLPPERPKRFRQMLERALVEGIITEEKAADLSGMTLDEWVKSHSKFDDTTRGGYKRLA
jgi:Zn-dependent peptidase ImmA (M78 family)/transcriptional regulator with XRE-family HTH domain